MPRTPSTDTRAPSVPPPPSRRAPVPSRWLAAMAVGFGLLVLAEAVLRARRGVPSDASPGVVLGGTLVVCGVGLLARAPATLACVALCFLTAAAMALRLHRTGELVPALPMGVLGVAIGYALFAERRRLLGLPRPASRPADAPRPDAKRRPQENEGDGGP